MSKKIYRVLDCVGREWHVSEKAVREDYTKFLMGADGLTREEAERAADSEDGRDAWRGYWFYEQIADCASRVMALGTLVADISDADKQAIVDRAARNGFIEIQE